MDVAVAIDFHPFAQVFETCQCVFRVDAPTSLFGIEGFGAVDRQARQFLLQVVVAQPIAVVQREGHIK